ncbi:hypothetical protein MJO28_012422 [Puccinia striiformis f. sp. tritici]|uniref:Uncharacterized protein n=1 Tax=Puccinia striiformis f. sp. tritici TaxID=168172 RepID=A0ACC0E206_9BASI|nr:hypothetical protein Pst134EB_023548 [Puccinia striiformis f. sp. tritici]KAI7942395.1 hypothetical protein MJO28_012422 [Puccinia striiformis f. sp. tritici]
MPPKTPRQSGASLPGVATPNLPTYSFGDIVLAKVKGHPAWPARIVDPYASPLNLRDERKIAQKNSYLVKFFKTADYAWMNAKEMSILESTEIRAFINNPNKKGAELKAAYQIALAPEAWEAELEEYQIALEEQTKTLEIDELENGEGDQAEKSISSAKSKQPKRKRASEPRTPVISTKKRKSVDARPINVPAKASATPEPAAAAAPALKKRGLKKKEVPEVPLDGESVVREWRHQLQRLFLGKVALTEDLMPEIDEVFTEIEEFEMKTEWLTSSKLAKVLKRVGVLEDSKVPLDAKYSIRARARALQEKWRNQLGLGDESGHRSKNSDGTDEAKAGNASPEDENGKENTDPTGVKNHEQVEVNGKGATKPSDPDNMKMDEDDSLPIKIAEEEETNKAEINSIEQDKIIEPPTEPAPEVSPVADVPQANGDHEASKEESEAMDVESEAVVGQAEDIKVDTEAVKAETEAVNDESDATSKEPEAAVTEAAVTEAAVSGETEAAAAKGDQEAVVDEVEATNGDHETTTDETKVVNGDEQVDEAVTKVVEVKTDGDVEMDSADVDQPKLDEKTAPVAAATTAVADDDGEQMDCADTPEPTSVEN